MPYTKNFRAPALLTGDARGALDAFLPGFLVNSMLPMNENLSLDFNFTQGSTALPAAAEYRSFNTESDVGQDFAGSRFSGKLPPISRRYHVDEWSQLSLNKGGTDQIGATFQRYALRLALAIGARSILAGAEAIEYGRVTITDRGLNQIVDYGRKAALTATAPALWSTTSDPITDLETLRAIYGSTPGRLVISPEIMYALQTNLAMRQYAYSGASSTPARVSPADILSVLATWGFPNVEVNQDRVTGKDGVERLVFSKNKVLFLPAGGGDSVPGAVGSGLIGGPLGTTDWGVTAEALADENGISEKPGIFVGAIPSDDPSGYDVVANAIVLPVLSNANASASLTVLAP